MDISEDVGYLWLSQGFLEVIICYLVNYMITDKKKSSFGWTSEMVCDLLKIK